MCTCLQLCEVKSVTMCADTVQPFDIKKDRFSCIMVKTEDLKCASDDEFAERLKKSVSVWREQGIRGVWVNVTIQQASLVPHVTQAGFVFHHAKAEYVMLKQWLSEAEAESLPGYASQYLGCAGLVLNDRQQVLVVQERFMKDKHWKLPGGLAEPGEEVWEAAAREVFEETGVRAAFDYVLCFRHQHGYHFGNSDLYFICVMRALSSHIRKCDVEIADARWMDLEEYVNHPSLTASNRHIARHFLATRHHAHIRATPVPTYSGTATAHWYGLEVMDTDTQQHTDTHSHAHSHTDSHTDSKADSKSTGSALQ